MALFFVCKYDPIIIHYFILLCLLCKFNVDIVECTIDIDNDASVACGDAKRAILMLLQQDKIGGFATQARAHL